MRYRRVCLYAECFLHAITFNSHNYIAPSPYSFAYEDTQVLSLRKVMEFL